MSADNELHFMLDNLPDEGLTSAVRAYLEAYGMVVLSLATGDSVKRGNCRIQWMFNTPAQFNSMRIDVQGKRRPA